MFLVALGIIALGALCLALGAIAFISEIDGLPDWFGNYACPVIAALAVGLAMAYLLKGSGVRTYFMRRAFVLGCLEWCLMTATTVVRHVMLRNERQSTPRDPPGSMAMLMIDVLINDVVCAVSLVFAVVSAAMAVAYSKRAQRESRTSVALPGSQNH